MLNIIVGLCTKKKKVNFLQKLVHTNLCEVFVTFNSCMHVIQTTVECRNYRQIQHCLSQLVPQLVGNSKVKNICE